MTSYTHLNKMGITQPLHIDKFSVNSIGFTDILRIVYERPKGSVLPVSKTFKFPRVQKNAVTGDGTTNAETVMVGDPALKAALEELQNIQGAKENKQSIADAMLEEIRQLEEDITCRSNYLKELAAKIKAG